MINPKTKMKMKINQLKTKITIYQKIGEEKPKKSFEHQPMKKKLESLKNKGKKDGSNTSKQKKQSKLPKERKIHQFN